MWTTMRHRSKSSVPSVPKSMWTLKLPPIPVWIRAWPSAGGTGDRGRRAQSLCHREEGYRYYETQFYNLVKRAREGEKPVH